MFRLLRCCEGQESAKEDLTLMLGQRLEMSRDPPLIQPRPFFFSGDPILIQSSSQLYILIQLGPLRIKSYAYPDPN